MNSTFAWIIVYALCCAFTWFVAKPYIMAALGPDMTPYTETGPYHGPGADRGRPGEFSPFYPTAGRR